MTDLYRSMRIMAISESTSREPFFSSTMSSGVPHKINTVWGKQTLVNDEHLTI